MKALVAGWFSFEDMGATAGDLLARDLACEWVERAGMSYDVANAPPFPGGVDWRAVDPTGYTHVVFVCGPFGNDWPVTDFLARFADCRLIGLNVSMNEPVDEWNPFDILIERDSSRTATPDITFLARPPGRVPVTGVILVHPQPYRGAMHEAVNEAVERLLASRELAVVRIDTRLDAPNASGLRTPAEVESLVSRMDVVITTRLHGMVLALKHGVPPVVIDPVAGGKKLRPQARAIGWPVILTADSLSDTKLREAFDYCLSDEARAAAAECLVRGVEGAGDARDRFVSSLTRPVEVR